MNLFFPFRLSFLLPCKMPALWLWLGAGGKTWCITTEWSEGPVPDPCHSLLVWTWCSVSPFCPLCHCWQINGCHLWLWHHGVMVENNGESALHQSWWLCFSTGILHTVTWGLCDIGSHPNCTPMSASTWFVNGKSRQKHFGGLPFPRLRWDQKSTVTFVLCISAGECKTWDCNIWT